MSETHNNAEGKTMESEYREFEIDGKTYRIYVSGKPSLIELKRSGWRPVVTMSDGHLAGTELASLFQGGSNTPVYSK